MGKASYIRFDWAVKKILRDKANFEVLEGLISTLIGEKIKIEEILESESNREVSDSKANRVDIKARNHRGEIIIVEVQNLYQMDFLQRILFGTAKAITEQVAAGDPYEHIKKVYSISVVYFDLGVGRDFIYRGQTSLVGDHEKDVLQLTRKEMEAYGISGTKDLFPEFIIIRVNEYQREAANAVEAWVHYLKTNELPETVDAPGFDRLKQVLKFENMSPEEYKAYMDHINDLKCEQDSLDDAYDKGVADGRAEGEAKGRAEGLEKGRAEGLEKGRSEEKLAIARNMLSMGISIDVVSKATGIDREELSRIKI